MRSAYCVGLNCRQQWRRSPLINFELLSTIRGVRYIGESKAHNNTHLPLVDSIHGLRDIVSAMHDYGARNIRHTWRRRHAPAAKSALD